MNKENRGSNEGEGGVKRDWREEREEWRREKKRTEDAQRKGQGKRGSSIRGVSLCNWQ